MNFELPIPVVNFFVVGVQKAGTSAINSYLSQHPEVYSNTSSTTSEFAYFVKDEFYNKGYDFFARDWFVDYHNQTIVCAKHVDLASSEIALKRLYEFNKKVKVLIVIRDPLKRAISAYQYYRLRGWEHRKDFFAAFEDEESDYFERGVYINQIKMLYDIFPSENVKVVLFEDFKKHPNLTLNEIAVNFLGLNEFQFDTKNRVNEGGKAKSIFLAKIVNHPWGNIKNILPLRLRTKIKSQLNSANHSTKKVDVKLTGDELKMIRSKYLFLNKELEAYLKVNLDSWRS